MKFFKNATSSNLRAHFTRIDKNSNRIIIIAPKNLILEKLKKKEVVGKNHNPISFIQFIS